MVFNSREEIEFYENLREGCMATKDYKYWDFKLILKLFRKC